MVRWLLLLVFTLAPLIGFEVYSHTRLRAEREAELGQEALRLLDLIQTEQQRIVDDIEHILATLAEADIAGPACQETMERLRQRLPSYLTLGFAARSGIVLCSTDRQTVGTGSADQPQIRQALTTGLFSVGEYVATEGPRHRVLPFALPYARNGGESGKEGGSGPAVVTALLDLDWLRQYQARKPLPPNVTVLLADRAGTVLVRVPDLQGIVGQPLPERLGLYLSGAETATALTEGLDGVARVTAYSPPGANGSGLAIAVGIDRAAALRTVDVSALWSWFPFLLILLFTLTGTAWAIGRLTRQRETERSLLKAVLEHLRAGVVVAEAPTGRMILHNSAAERLIGQPLGRIDRIEDYPRPFTGSPSEGSSELPLVRALRDGTVVRQEELRRDTPAGPITCLADAEPVRDSDGCITLAVVTLTDITERKTGEEALRRSETRFRELVENTPVMMWINRPDGGREYYNAAWRSYTGRSLEHGERWSYIHPADYPRLLDCRERGIAAGESYGFDVRMQRHDGAYRWHVCRINPMRQNGQIIAWVGTAVDVHDSRMAREAAEQADRSKSRFLAAASHDLRQPMQSMFFFAEALHSHVHSPRGRDALAMLERGMETLKGLLDSLLDVSQLDAGVIEPRIEDIAVKPLLDDIGSSYAPVAAAKGLDLQVVNHHDLTVRSDRNLLGRMVRNLVENAIRYTERGVIRLECHPLDGHAGIQVRDTGIGISGEQMSWIFEEFYQVGNPERDRNQGLGLGLAIVQKLSALLGHPVEVRSELGKGSVFRISVPLGDATESPAPALPPRETERGRLAVLIDDDAIVLMGLRSIFQDWGYDTIVASSTEEALARLRAAGRRPDVMVADYRLREHKVGTEAILKIRELAGAPVPAVLLTGDSGPDVMQEAERHGIGVMFKPVTARLLQEALTRQTGTAA
ncbi:hybrid sensor histidine kinase/response regulator (plasmid) [Azospirillum baldaniorum]|uniref:histidine kinase n=1 Tax=Azospirillum baldaniorum TaxID=1064539 RepID=A0A9P1K0D2_9PROT|nr:ATP-binding protein [Azospirillum baldaniorum]AWJ94782.1 hybrid sensor histidine kinase/response regulator [Azospirillum baldaniorum]TWA67868.1 PAS domain S-box-containing protein [Azospirillum brasilense]CCD03204.1 two-component hybrid sensor and regulator (modular protein) [Azospirillum baldaniorum]